MEKTTNPPDDIEALQAYALAHNITLDLNSPVLQRAIRLRISGKLKLDQPAREIDPHAETCDQLAVYQVQIARLMENS